MNFDEVGPPTLDLLTATVAAAAASWPLVGEGDKNGVDQLAVDAMRASLRVANFTGVVVIGEGEKDEAPMLFNGEVVGAIGATPKWDIAVDPIDGTALAAGNIEGAVSVIAAAERGALLDCSNVYYMQKLVTGADGIGVCDIDMTATQNIAALAAAKDVAIADIRVAVINKERNYDLIAEVEATGATWVRFDEGDVAMAVAAATDDSGIDMLLGIGGAPEGVATACAVQILGGHMQARLAPGDVDEITRAFESGYDLEKKYELQDLASGDRHVFVLSGVTDGLLVRGIREVDEKTVEVQSFLLDSALDDGQIIDVRVELNFN
ncbi:MAG: fructose-bisphosphatase class II family protein [Micrococcales bacterium]